MVAVILAGGGGTRLRPLTDGLPKVLIELKGKPLLEYLFECLCHYDIHNVILCTGYGSKTIERWAGKGDRFGLRIRYSEEESPLGTAGAVKNIPYPFEETFLVFYGDVLVWMDLEKLIKFHRQKQATATLVLHPSSHPYDSDLVEIDEDGRIRRFPRRPVPGEHFVNLTSAALYVLEPVCLSHIPYNKHIDFGKEIFPKMLAHGERIFGYVTGEYLKDVGTPQRYQEVLHDLHTGIYRSCVLKSETPVQKPQAVFLDRDGVINEEVDLLRDPAQLQLISGAAKAIRLLNDQGILAIVVTNQPVVARNLCTEEDLKRIHDTLRGLLSKEAGARLDAIYYCPHHPETHHPDRNTTYRVDCECRKPKIGMLVQAAKDFNLSLGKCIIIGDSSRDVQTGKNAGLKTVLVRTGYGGKDGKYAVDPDQVCENLFEAITKLVDHY